MDCPVLVLPDMNPSSATRSASVRRERGYAITEVLIAAVLLVLVSGAFLQLVVGSSQAQASVKVRQKQQAVSEGLIEQLRVDSKWTKECTEQAEAAGSLDGACVVQVGEMYQDADFAKDPKTGVTYRIKATATAVDSKGDGLGAADEDGSPVDFFEVKTTVEAPDGTNVGALSSTSVVDPFSSVATGSLHLDVCAMPIQVDERVVVSGCATDLPLDRTSVDPDDLAAFDALPVARRMMQVDPIVSNVRVTGLDDISSVTQTVRTNAAGRVEFDRLRPGRYRVEVLAPPAGLTLWESKSVPEMTISVEPYQTVDAMVAYRREAADDYKIRLESVEVSGTTRTYSLGIARTVRLRLLPMPAGRVPIASVNAIATYSGTKVTKLTFPAPAPGLYRAKAVNGLGNLEQLERFNRGTRGALDHIWISTPSVPAGAGADGDTNDANDDAAMHVVQLKPAGDPTAPSSSDEPAEPTSPPEETGPITYPVTDTYDDAATCTWRTPAALRRQFGSFGAILAPTNPAETNPGVRQCAPCGNVSVKHEALASTVNIHCGRNAACQQNIELTDGTLWAFSRKLSGGALDVWCYQDATCKQSGAVAGNLVSKFVCLPQSSCTQTLAASQSLLSGQVGSAADVWCYPQGRCTQLATMRPGATATVNCFPRGRCDQRMTSVFTWATARNPRLETLDIECHPEATCTQVLGKTNRWDGLFSSLPSGPLKMACRPESSCNQSALMGSFGDLGFQMACYRAATCRQIMTVGSVFRGRGGKPARQTCTEEATCTQNIQRATPAGVLDQMCHKPIAGAKDADEAVGPACDLTGTSRRGIFSFIVQSNTLMQCATEEWCKMTLTGGGWGSFTGRKPYRQLCISRLDCNQHITRYADLFSGLTEAYQDCQTSRGACTQFARVVDDSIFGNGKGPRRQLCDSRTSCNQDMRGTLNDSASWSFFGTTNDIYQLCNEVIPNMPGGGGGSSAGDPKPEPEIDGDFDPDAGGVGGA